MVSVSKLKKKNGNFFGGVQQHQSVAAQCYSTLNLTLTLLLLTVIERLTASLTKSFLKSFWFQPRYSDNIKSTTWR